MYRLIHFQINVHQRVFVYLRRAQAGHGIPSGMEREDAERGTDGHFRRSHRERTKGVQDNGLEGRRDERLKE